MGWTSLYVQEWECPTDVEEFEAEETPDQTLVVFLQGSAILESWTGSGWEAAYRTVGSAGLTAPGEPDRLRWRSPGATHVQAAYVFIPEQLLVRTREELRRAGQRTASAPLSALRLDDATLYGIATGLIAGVRSNASNLYAQSAAIFLATHLNGLSDSALRMRHRLTSTQADQRANRAIEYMKERLAENITIDDLAREAGISEFHFVRMFRERIGVTPAQYLHRLRMDRAHELLATSDMPISQVALQCGYTNHSAFSATVRTHTGVSPSVLRQRSISDNR